MNASVTRGARYGALVATVLGLGACSWFTDFREQPKLDPWESTSDTTPMRGNPQNSVSVFGTAAPGYQYGRLPTIGALDSMAGIPNPVGADPRSLRNGRMYYQINCAVCHGEAGKGDGPATATKQLFPPPLVGASAEGRSDGYIWAIIRNGRGAMPSYNRIEELDRWDVVNYVRGLQGRYPVEVGPVGYPGETGDKVPGFSRMGPTRPAPYYIHAGSQAGPTRGALDVPGGAASTSPPAGAAGMAPPSITPPVTDSMKQTPSTGRPTPALPTTPKTGGER